MEILPAIDLKNGFAVRLKKGEMNSAKIYSDKPWELAEKFADLGAKWLHIVDLDGAFAGEAKNAKTIEKIVKSTNLKIEVGGGIRDEERIKFYKNSGVSRFILGSAALKNPEFVKQMAKKYKIAVGIDAKNGFVATEGWAEVSNIKACELAKIYADAGVEAIICTDISKDGMLSGVNVKFSEEIAKSSGIKTIASGGVKDLSDIKALKQSGKIYGVIVGKAYYEGSIDLKEAFLIAK
ncbi:1-(5-phosphoribosyl)-5-[(5-phosphoribosylamino)methylideneamino]imidazole-4-carboxamide isomerase [Campylobacter hominis]|uniref:1-(5-phosphoribosyl)-5-[(5-phosphoribosylamino)methylideneamino] imidazole-4-carboxamide isomerase n=1 Tax=Campylobacter hominis (strain ATCC BAA-381 / DSM 21671 / CCUG 45161 / LMG 19568 / NCTC 13146 / CH001A) TaxID=360107 RepID=HIS4_CAMHC|nr:1-(5-phosphoribosyl)-5-[(5-phosphoribosylamino)methylideneamino]imidazole-4-carboxamide isomerase [Campylobacter hominis]A7I1W6.1 RecName: Full=1-(5-phosphoribosyl)-5-[(5-phosphoribosylamino)methylideneamino] imidazole-4-carboxamide isomerase; AltName: Full=Phosphoribosylformimino-5-aminoimidazole carboxamide ribotide isomerase [Campylobacter hominis ATCC BAA-381]ABS51650.1 phosphoribosylformimino-5-aminoimidazole carboxamide ribotide isomerase [Campylobacter hominis ATCC BAA-381]UAK86210.1 1